MPYRQAWKLQQAVAQARRHRDIPGDCVLLLEHPPVYTMGRSGLPEHLRAGQQHLLSTGADYVEVDRGGSVTFHGPGQLVAYPIIDVARAFPLDTSSTTGDVIRYIRTLEAAVMFAVGGLGIACGLNPPRTGVWVGDPPAHKLAAIGVKVAAGVSTHGIALNVATDLSWFRHIVPCGIPGASVTSLASLGASDVTVDVCGEAVAAALAERLALTAVPAEAPLTSLIRRELQHEQHAA